MAIVTIKPVDGYRKMYIKFHIPDELIEKGDFYFTSGMNAKVNIEYEGKDELKRISEI